MPLRILVVEDHAPFRQLVCSALQRRAEFEIIEATDGIEAVHKIEALLPDVILLDIHLPKMNGFEVAKQVRRLSPRSRLLFMSHESSPDIVRRALSLGSNGYIQKSSAGTDLLSGIDAALAGHRFLSRSVASAAATHRHEIVFCPDDAAVVDVFACYLAAALNAADAAIALVAESHREHLLQALRARHADVDDAIERRACLLLDADVELDPVRFLAAIDCVRSAAVTAGKAHPRIAFCGERAGRLWAAGRTEEAVQVEKLCGEVPADVDILCAYPVPHNGDDRSLTRISAGHTAVSTC